MNEGLKREEIRPCDVCGAKHGTPLLYRVHIESHALDRAAIQQLMGLEAYFGHNAAGARVASMFSPNSEYSKELWHNDLIVCSDCAVNKLGEFFPNEEGGEDEAETERTDAPE